MSQVITMPKLGLTMNRGQVINWLKKEGNYIKAGEPIVEIQTDKISYEVEAEEDGYILQILAKEGEEKEVLAPLCIIGEKGETPDEIQDKVQDEKQGESQEEKLSKTQPAVKKDNKVSNRIFISPIARKIAKENGLDYTRIKGTGPQGRIVKKDIMAAIKEEERMDKNTTKTEVSVQIVDPVVESTARKVPLAGIRKVIAQRLAQSKHDIPHVYFKSTIDAGSIVDLKDSIGEKVRLRAGKKLSINEIIIKAVALALEEFPDINVSLINDEIIYHDHINIGMAVNIDKGLVVPVIKDANRKSLSQISKDACELIDRARSSKLSQEDLTGGTFTISNLGMYHIDEFSAVINPPESAILAVGRSVEKPSVENGAVVVKKVINLTLSVDHRVIDGALAAQFMKKIKDLLEDSYSILI